MKIGLFFPAIEYGGQEKNLVALANAMYKKNVFVDVITYDDKKFITQTLNPKINRIFLNKSNTDKLSIFKLFNFNHMIGTHLKSLFYLYNILRRNDYGSIICFQAGGLVSLLKKISGTDTKIIIRESISSVQTNKNQKSQILK